MISTYLYLIVFQSIFSSVNPSTFRFFSSGILGNLMRPKYVAMCPKGKSEKTKKKCESEAVSIGEKLACTTRILSTWKDIDIMGSNKYAIYEMWLFDLCVLMKWSSQFSKLRSAKGIYENAESSQYVKMWLQQLCNIELFDVWWNEAHNFPNSGLQKTFIFVRILFSF